MVYRYLRTLEGISPPLSLTHLSCQATAKAFVSTRKLSHIFYRSRVLKRASVFDRMFSLGVRGSGTDTAPPGGVNSRVTVTAAPGPRRHFLYCSLKDAGRGKDKPRVSNGTGTAGGTTV
jgi:hypothetical protein